MGHYIYALFVTLAVQQCFATISFDQIGECKQSFYEKRIQNFNLNKLGGELTNVYITSDYQPSITSIKQTFKPTEEDNIYNMVANIVVLNNGKKEKFSQTSTVVANSDGTFTITEYTSDDGEKIELDLTMYAMFSGASGGIIFYICNPGGTSTHDLRSLILPTKGIAYGAYGISEMIQVDQSLGFSGKLRKLQRR